MFQNFWNFLKQILTLRNIFNEKFKISRNSNLQKIQIFKEFKFFQKENQIFNKTVIHFFGPILDLSNLLQQ